MIHELGQTLKDLLLLKYDEDEEEYEINPVDIEDAPHMTNVSATIREYLPYSLEELKLFLGPYAGNIARRLHDNGYTYGPNRSGTHMGLQKKFGPQENPDGNTSYRTWVHCDLIKGTLFVYSRNEFLVDTRPIPASLIERDDPNEFMEWLTAKIKALCDET